MSVQKLENHLSIVNGRYTQRSNTITALTNKIINHLNKNECDFEITESEHGSVYITNIENHKVKQIRISNHEGHKTRSNEWNLRTDAMTHRYNKNIRVYHSSAVNQLLKDLK